MAPRLAPEPVGESLPNWTLGSAANWDLIPPHMRPALIEYVEHGRLESDFLSALVENDLRRTFERADHVNQARIGDWLKFFFNYVPAPCWGSIEKANAWQARGGLHRKSGNGL